MDKVITKSRIEVLDILRGIFVTALIVIHLRLHPNFILMLTGRSKLWVSVGEGFFVVSGFLIGYLNKNTWNENVLLSTKKLVKRASKLYLWSVATTIIFTLWGNVLPVEYAKDGLWQLNSGNFILFIYKTLKLQYFYGWADYLSLYAVYILLTPLVFWIAKKFGYFLPLIISLVVWYFRGESLHMGMQIVFFSALLVGFYYDQVNMFFKTILLHGFEMVKSSINIIFWVTLILSIISVHYFGVVLSVFNIFGVNSEFIGYLTKKNLVLNYYFDKQTVGVGRLFITPIWFFGFFGLAQKYATWLGGVFGGIFKKFGRNSLKVYLIHSFVIFPIPWILAKLNLSGYIFYTAVTLAVLIIIYYINEWTKNFKI